MTLPSTNEGGLKKGEFREHPCPQRDAAHDTIIQFMPQCANFSVRPHVRFSERIQFSMC